MMSPSHRHAPLHREFGTLFMDIAFYVLIPFHTLFFARNSNWFTTNFSVIGNRPGRWAEFFFWSILIGTYFYCSLRTISFQVQPPLKSNFLLPVSLVLFYLAILTPYLPELVPFKSFLHVMFAFFSSCCLAVYLFFLIYRLARSSPEEYFSFLCGIVVIVIFSAYLLIACNMVTSALEIFFSLSCSMLCRRLLRRTW